MIKSMTGYGRGTANIGDISFTVDIRSVNSRYLDINLRLPSTLYSYENELKKAIKTRLDRGKVDVYIKSLSSFDYDASLEINEPLLIEYLKKVEDLSQRFDLENNLKVSHFIKDNDIFVLRHDEDDDLKKAHFECAKNALSASLDALVEARSVEGKSLYEDLSQKLLFIYEKVEEIKRHSEEYNKELKSFYFDKINALVEDFKLDKDRVYTEVALLIDKSCIDEEVVRLSSHIAQLKDVLESDFSVGKKLDFLVQEMNREANTILSKSKSVQLSAIGLDIKTEIEKIREQIQNIE